MRPETISLLETFHSRDASDLYITYGSVPVIRVHDALVPAGTVKFGREEILAFMADLLTAEQIDEYETTLELNTAINWEDKARLRINVYQQQQQPALVIRNIKTRIPTIEELELPAVYRDLILQKRGLVLVVGQTGCGKSTSMAAMVGHRNQHGSGHIITIEDPIEFVHAHNKCIVSQRDVGIDTYSFGMALKNTLRQHPDVILIGEIRDRETMEHAIVFAETGHLCLATLHANNSSQAVERIINFFPEEMHKQILLNLSVNLKAILSQRLVPDTKDSRSLVAEVMINEGYIRDLLQEGRIKEIREMMAKSRDRGMCTFDQALLDLYSRKIITEATAVNESDNPGNQRLAIKQMTMDQRIGTYGMVTQEEITASNRSDF